VNIKGDGIKCDSSLSPLILFRIARLYKNDWLKPCGEKPRGMHDYASACIKEPRSGSTPKRRVSGAAAPPWAGDAHKYVYAEGVTHEIGAGLFNAFSVTDRFGFADPGCALDRLGANLGYGV
jgi:hypothetical protein